MLEVVGAVVLLAQLAIDVAVLVLVARAMRATRPRESMPPAHVGISFRAVEDQSPLTMQRGSPRARG